MKKSLMKTKTLKYKLRNGQCFVIARAESALLYYWANDISIRPQNYPKIDAKKIISTQIDFTI